MLALMGDKSLLFSTSGKSFVMYGKRGRSWIALSDPVGPYEAGLSHVTEDEKGETIRMHLSLITQTLQVGMLNGSFLLNFQGLTA